MKIAQFASFGRPDEVIESIEVPDLANPVENEVLIDVLACPINPADVLNIEGRYGVRPDLPARLGAECVGKVKKIGESVKKFKEGDIVLPLDRENWVQQKLVAENNLILLPNNIDPIQLSMLKVNPATAYLMLKKYVNLKEGDWIIQDAANSGVGHCIIRLAKKKSDIVVVSIFLNPLQFNSKSDFMKYPINLTADKKKFIRKKLIFYIHQQ